MTYLFAFIPNTYLFMRWNQVLPWRRSNFLVSLFASPVSVVFRSDLFPMPHPVLYLERYRILGVYLQRFWNRLAVTESFYPHTFSAQGLIPLFCSLLCLLKIMLLVPMKICKNYKKLQLNNH